MAFEIRWLVRLPPMCDRANDVYRRIQYVVILGL